MLWLKLIHIGTRAHGVLRTLKAEFLYLCLKIVPLNLLFTFAGTHLLKLFNFISDSTKNSFAQNNQQRLVYSCNDQSMKIT